MCRPCVVAVVVLSLAVCSQSFRLKPKKARVTTPESTIAQREAEKRDDVVSLFAEESAEAEDEAEKEDGVEDPTQRDYGDSSLVEESTEKDEEVEDQMEADYSDSSFAEEDDDVADEAEGEPDMEEAYADSSLVEESTEQEVDEEEQMEGDNAGSLFVKDSGDAEDEVGDDAEDEVEEEEDARQVQAEESQQVLTRNPTIVVCRHSSSAGKGPHHHGLPGSRCDTAGIKPKFDLLVGQQYFRNYGKRFTEFGNSYTRANKACSKALPTVRRSLPKFINGKRVLINMGNGKWKVDNSQLKSNSKFLSWRLYGAPSNKNPEGRKVGPYPGPKWGSVLGDVDKEYRSVVRFMNIHDSSKGACKAFLWNGSLSYNIWDPR